VAYYLKISGIKASSTRKSDMISALDNYLSNEQNIINIWNGLKPFEKELMEEYIRSRGSLEYDEIREIFQKHDMGYKSGRYGFAELFDEHSAARLFIMHHSIPVSIVKILTRLVPPVEIKYTVSEEITAEDADQIVVIGESFAGDFIRVIKLANTTKLRATRGSRLPTKAAVLKINEVLEFKEPLNSSFTNLGEIRVIEQTTRIYGLSRLMIEAGILQETEGVLVVGDKGEQFLKIDIVSQCKILLNAYLESSSIYELDRIREIKLKTERDARLKGCRELILKYLAQCPENSWISMGELLHFIKKNDRKYLTNVVGEILSYDDYHREYYSENHSWEEVDGRFVEIVFLEYLSAMGIVDVAISWIPKDDFREDKYFTAAYFRLTKLGAFVLGVTDKYDYLERLEKSGFIIQPNYELIVAEGSMKNVHMLFLDKFAERMSQGEAGVYKISFGSIVSALEKDISVEEIIAYLQEYSSNGIPEEVLITLKKWEFESKRIWIRKVTIVETDDRYLLEELKNIKTVNNSILSELPYVFEIDEKSVNKVKRELEKKYYFCIIK